jgi:hypothetical protein
MVLCLVPSSAGAFSKAVWGGAYLNGINQFPIYRSLGASIDENTLWWNEVAPTRPQHPTDPADPAYHWPADLDQTISQARAFHMRVMLLLMFSPPWANGGHPMNWAPTHPKDLADFATAAARRYPGVHLWMIWSEANRAGDFMPISHVRPGARLNHAQQAAPHLYARMLDASYGALKRVSRQNLVIGGSTMSGGDIRTKQWVMNLRLPNGRPPRMDMYAHNPFGWRVPRFSSRPSPAGIVQFADLPRLAHWLDRYLRPGLPLFLAEYSISTSHDREFPWHVNERVAAKWITCALREARHWKRIYALGWVHVYDYPPIAMGGLLTEFGSRKPGFTAFAHG